MLLKDVEEITPLKQKAIDDGVQTLDQYSWWIIGYESGYSTRHKDSMNTITKKTKGTTNEKEL